MRNAILLLLLSCFLFGCKRNTDVRLKIKDAEELYLSQQPDSALTLIKTITNPDLLDNKTFALWCLTYAEISDQLGEDMPFVPQMERASEYYEEHGTTKELIKSLMYLGQAYEEEKKFDNAMQVFLKAVDLAKSDKDCLLVGKLYNNIGKLHDFEDDYDESQRFYQLSGEYYLKGGDSLNYVYSIRDIGWIYTLKEEYGSALESYLQAYKLALNLNDSLLLSSVTNRLGNNYEEMNNYTLAEKYLFQSIAYDEAGSAPTYLALANLYTSQKEYTKARYYISMANRLRSTNQMFEGGLLYQQYILEKELGDYELSLNYYEQYTSFADSISDLQENTNLLKVKKRYEYEHLLNENKNLDIKNQWAVIVCCCLVIICLLLIVLYRYYMALKEKQIKKQQQLIQAKHYSLVQKELEIKGLSFTIQKIRENVFKSSSVYKKIIKNSLSIEQSKDNALNDKEWIALKECVKSTYPAFFDNLQDKFPNLTEEEIRFCCLLKIGLDSQQLSILLDIQSASVSRRRNRIMKKGGLENTNTTLEKLIKSM